MEPKGVGVFRLVNVKGRASLEDHGQYFDVARMLADEAFSHSLHAVAHSDQLHELAARCLTGAGDGEIARVRLGPPVLGSRQIFGIGLNYLDHAGETGANLPPVPLTFTKFPTCLAGAGDEIGLSGDQVDWEVEIVAVVGATASHVAVEEAWNYVAGLTLGQDISDRRVQRAGTPPQFSLGKSFSNYGPIGPAMVSSDSFVDRDDIALWCDVSSVRMQKSRSRHLIFSIPTLVAYLSSICTLLPGDLIFTGTPSGVGAARGQFLVPGDVIRSGAEVIGIFENLCVAGAGPLPLSPPVV